MQRQDRFENFLTDDQEAARASHYFVTVSFQAEQNIGNPGSAGIPDLISIIFPDHHVASLQFLPLFTIAVVFVLVETVRVEFAVS